VLYAFPREDIGEGEIRLGVSVGRRVGGAVERNRVKRLLREAFWAIPELVSERYDYVVVARPDAAQLAESGGTESFRADLAELLRRLDGHEESVGKDAEN
jgi:ribonuclease P protein component